MRVGERDSSSRRMSRTAVLVLCVCLSAVRVRSQEQHYAMTQSSFTLLPELSPLPAPLTGLLWRHGSDKAIEWDPDHGTEAYGHFEGRAVLNVTTGELRLGPLTLLDSGPYSLEVSSDTQVLKPTRITLWVIAPVPKPVVLPSCNDDKTICTLSCDGDTTDAGNVSFTWKTDEKVVTHSSRVILLQGELEHAVHISCWMGNNVSQEHSEAVCSPLLSGLDCSGVRLNVGVIVFIILIAALLVLVLVHRWRAGVWFFNQGYMPWEAEFWSKQETDATAADTASETQENSRVKYRFVRRKSTDESPAASNKSPA